MKMGDTGSAYKCIRFQLHAHGLLRGCGSVRVLGSNRARKTNDQLAKVLGDVGDGGLMPVWSSEGRVSSGDKCQ